MRNIFRSLLIVSLVASITFSCNDDKEPVPTKLLSIKQIGDRFTYDDVWFVVWDDNGELLGYRKVTSDTLTFNTKKEIESGKVTLGYFRRTGTAPILTYITIQTDIEVGRDIEFVASPTRPPIAGMYKVRVTNAPYAGVNISNKYNSSYSTADIGDPTHNEALSEGANKVIITYDQHPESYGLFTDVKVDDNLTLDYNDFTLFENHVTVNLPKASDFWAAFNGYEARQSFWDTGYILDDSAYPGDTPSSYTMGYFNGLSKFRTAVTALYDGAEVQYLKYGDLPGEIVWPDVTKYNLDNSDPNSFAFSATEPVEYIFGSWTIDNVAAFARLTIASPQLTPKIGKVPQEMIAANPAYEIGDSYTFSNASLLMKGYQSYADYVNAYFAGVIPEYEQMSVTFYYAR